MRGIRSRRLVYKEVVEARSNLTSGDLGISLLVIGLRVTRLKKARVEYLLGLFAGRWEKEQCDILRVECL